MARFVCHLLCSHRIPTTRYLAKLAHGLPQLHFAFAFIAFKSFQAKPTHSAFILPVWVSLGIAMTAKQSSIVRVQLEVRIDVNFCLRTLTWMWGLQVLVAFGRDDSLNYITSCEVWDPASGTFSTTLAGSVAVPRFSHDAVKLSDGRILAAGGGCCFAFAVLCFHRICFCLHCISKRNSHTVFSQQQMNY